MKHLFWIKFAALLFVLAGKTVVAVEVTNLYTGKVLVTDKTFASRKKAHRWAIEQVFTKVTGTRDILQNKTILRLLRNYTETSTYITSYGFSTDNQGRIFLIDEFDKTKVDALLRQVKASIWGQRRPQTLIWLVVEEGLARNIIAPSVDPQLAEVVLQSADDRGLPVLLPNMDEQDSKAIFTSDIWARFEQPVLTASQRYNTPNYVMARMYYHTDETSGVSSWILQYQLMAQEQVLLKAEQKGDSFVILKQMINQLSDYFASQYAIKSESLAADNLQLTLYNIANVVELVSAENLLIGLPPVANVSLLQFHQHQAVFNLKLSGEPLDVIKALSLLSEFKQRILLEPNNNKPALTDDELLEQLAQEYIGQPVPKLSDIGQAEPQRLNLKYDWLGNR